MFTRPQKKRTMPGRNWPIRYVGVTERVALFYYKTVIETVQTRTRVKVKGSALLFLECDIFIIHSFLSYPLVRCGS